MTEKWHQWEVEQVAEHLAVDLHNGLPASQAEKRLAEVGPNELVEQGLRSPWRILWEQLKATMVLILLAAALISLLIGDFKDAIAIGAIVVLFVILGFVQDYRAEKAMAALKRMATPLVRVKRDGTLREIVSTNLVPGDLIQLEAGNIVPADVRIVESANLRIQEAALTGESEPVEKETRAYPGMELSLGDRRNLAYMGTVVTYGRGTALVVETGMRTELGQIASMLQTVGAEQTPLQKRLDQLGKVLAIAGLVVAAIIFVLGILRGEPLEDMLLTSVSIAVAVIPEGLPAVVTITLAIGAQRMLKRQALIRRLPAVETLGSVTVICSDKTGTLTENRMTVVVLDVAGHRVDLSQSMHNRMPMTEALPPPVAPGQALQTAVQGLNHESIGLLLAGGALVNDAVLIPIPETDRYQSVGDPTEGALLVAAAVKGLLKADLELGLPRVAELPFDSDRKRMSTVHQFKLEGANKAQFDWIEQFSDRQPYVIFTKGAVDGLLAQSSHVWNDGKLLPLDEDWRSRIQAANDQFAQQGMRVLGLAYRFLPELPAETELPQIEQDLAIIGLFGMIDPPRKEVQAAVQVSKQAGIRPVMITGDHPLTAQEIARQLGIISQGVDAPVVTGSSLANMSDAELAGMVDRVSVYARVSPEHKLRIVQALQSRGQIVAMTGDGVNDAPALKRADIGVAMGITGTDVTKEAADMVLQDDNFATIIAAVEEGRTIYDNLRKFITFSISGNIGKVMVMLLAPFLGKPLPLTPLQLLWLNLLTDGLLGLGLGVEPPEKNTMSRPPYSPKAGIFAGGLLTRIIWVGLLIGAIGLGVGYYYWSLDPNGNWQTMTFTTLAFVQVAQAFASRSAHESFFSTGFRSNIPLVLLALAVIGLQLVVVYVPFFQRLFYTQPLSLDQMGVSITASLVVFFAIEVEKWLLRRLGK